MARRTIYGRHIISAGEIGSYTVCPEAWRLRTVQRVRRSDSPTASAGEKMHRDWAQTYEEAVYLSRSVRVMVLLIILTIIIYMLS